MIVVIIAGVLFAMFLALLLVTDTIKAVNNKIDETANRMVDRATK